MLESKKLIEKLYSNFQQKNWRGMQECYHDEASFSDPVFEDLRGAEVKVMWHMLTTAAKDLEISYKEIKAEGSTGSCDWEARYTFSRTGKKVHNIIHATFEFKDGKIFKHKDDFDLWRWAGMALGTGGKLLGWTPMIKTKIRGIAGQGLRKFLKEHPEYGL